MHVNDKLEMTSDGESGQPINHSVKWPTFLVLTSFLFPPFFLLLSEKAIYFSAMQIIAKGGRAGERSK